MFAAGDVSMYAVLLAVGAEEGIQFNAVNQLYLFSDEGRVASPRRYVLSAVIRFGALGTGRRGPRHR
jgi:hypothetical protein